MFIPCCFNVCSGKCSINPDPFYMKLTNKGKVLVTASLLRILCVVFINNVSNFFDFIDISMTVYLKFCSLKIPMIYTEYLILKLVRKGHQTLFNINNQHGTVCFHMAHIKHVNQLIK